ncbi:uncharacterized protein LOC127722306 [Mytilus californianus]|uniref:uncharacterized protein LOC127722306 n=1 Tax=Mytilus californianus TaxID=6549 RepID=UPI0022466EC1|nr:uncharacterized protein LOC127722306 [Mytilus californianus]
MDSPTVMTSTPINFKTPTRKRLLFSESLSPVFGPENGQNVAHLNEQGGIFKTPTRKRLFFSESLSPVFESRQKVARLSDQEIISIEWETEETKEDTIEDSPVSLFEEAESQTIPFGGYADSTCMQVEYNDHS